MAKKLKSQITKQLESSRAAELVAKPGRLPGPSQPGAFLHRVREGSSQIAPDRILAASKLLQHRLWGQVVESTLIALHRIFGISAEASGVRSVKRRRMKNHKQQATFEQSHEVLRSLLERFQSTTTEAMAAQLILNEDGELQLGEEAEELINKRRRIPDERPAEIWAKPTFYTDNPLTHLPR